MTSFMEKHKLSNFGYMTISTICFKSHDKILLVKSWTKVMTSQPLFQNIYILRKPGVANFAGIIQIANTPIKTTYKDKIKVKKN